MNTARQRRSAWRMNSRLQEHEAHLPGLVVGYTEE